MGGEDFGRFGKAGVPICMLRLGAVSQKRLDEFARKHQRPIRCIRHCSTRILKRH